MKKLIIISLLLFLSACEVGNFPEHRQKLYKNSGWDSIENIK